MLMSNSTTLYNKNLATKTAYIPNSSLHRKLIAIGIAIGTLYEIHQPYAIKATLKIIPHTHVIPNLAFSIGKLGSKFPLSLSISFCTLKK